MDTSRTALVICGCLAPEIEQTVPCGTEIRIIDQGLHDYPKLLNEKIQAAITQLDQEDRWDTILLGFGLCSEGTVGLQSRRSRIVLPKTDDCIAIFLGSREKYLEQFEKEPGTYYFTKGWLRDGAGPLAMYQGTHEWTKKYSKAKAQAIAREIMKNYKRIALIDTGIYDLAPFEARSRLTAEIFGIQFEIVPGSLEIIKALVDGSWDRRYVSVEPGQAIARKAFV
jgi:hypothetical protein